MNQVFDNELFEAFANASDNIYIYVTDIATDVTRWSKKAVEFFNLSGEYLTGVKDMWPMYIHPDDVAIYVADITAVFNGTSTQHNCQYRVRNRYGEYVWVECRGSIIFDSDGMPSVFAGIMTRLDNQNKYDALTHQLSGYELFRYDIHESGSLMLIGIDKLRTLNSRYGNLYGNRVIAYLAKVLQKAAGHMTLYRYWGGDFVVYGKNVETQEMIATFKKAFAACNEVEQDSDLANFVISAGIVGFSKYDSMSTLMRRAEMAMAYAKRNNASHVCVYTEEIEKQQLRRSRISEDLIRSIQNNFEGFYLVYQPLMSNDGDEVCGCEALLRWKPGDASIGSCYPGEFIEILEENGGIKEVGSFVMRETIRQQADWSKRYKKFYSSFNVSYLQMEDPEFIPSILKTCKEFDVDPENIVMELTESVLARDTVMVKKSFEMLRDGGIRIALDDFGTGNSSFWTLHNISVDIIKLDQSFVRGLDASDEKIDYAIVESVALMCKLIGCHTVAEGIENEEVWKCVEKYKFSSLQGYHFSRPIPLGEFEVFLQNHAMGL